MEKIEGMLDDFSHARVVYLTTFDEEGSKWSRPMTNYNSDPYSPMWFSTLNGTKKVEHIKSNSKVLVVFPREKISEFYEITGRAEFASGEVVDQKWRWWELYWLPEYKKYNWFQQGSWLPEWKLIISVYPLEARVVRMANVDLSRGV